MFSSSYDSAYCIMIMSGTPMFNKVERKTGDPIRTMYDNYYSKNYLDFLKDWIFILWLPKYLKVVKRKLEID